MKLRFYLITLMVLFMSACASQRLDSSSFVALFQEDEASPALSRDALHYPPSIAVLLPLSHPSLANTAEAVQKGLLTAYYQDKQKSRTTLQFYDVSEPKDASKMYQKALQNGAEAVIGPLTKEAIAKLTSDSTFSVPTLALNYTTETNTGTSNLFQFALSPEDELVQLAHFAWKTGHHQAAIISLDDDWGKRLTKSFKEAWGQLGGTTNAELFLNASHSNLSETLRTFLFPQVKAGFLSKQLKKSNNQSLYRKDIDFILLLMFPEQARQILPLLKYYRIDDLPVYGTSHVYSEANPALNNDLDGLIFCDMPWILKTTPLKQQAKSLLIHELQHQSRLYALGYDAYHIILRLKSFNNSGRYTGLTGNVFMDEHQRLHRSLPLAKLQNGSPVLIK